MKDFSRIVGWMLAALSLLLLLLLWGNKQLETRDTFEEIRTRLEQKNISLEEHGYSMGAEKLYYVTTGKPLSQTLLFIHGSPGDWTAWEQLLMESELVEKYRIVIVDRPPYKGSTTGGGNLRKQSRALKRLIEAECHPCTLVGHSYGGALALQLAVDFPHHTNAVVSLAGTVASDYQHPKWYNTLAQSSWITPFLTDGLIASNKEMLSLVQDLDALIPALSTMHMPFYFMQGGNDVLVDPRSPFILLPHFNEVEIKFNSAWDHFVIWTALPAVEEIIEGANR